MRWCTSHLCVSGKVKVKSCSHFACILLNKFSCIPSIFPRYLAFSACPYCLNHRVVNSLSKFLKRSPYHDTVQCSHREYVYISLLPHTYRGDLPSTSHSLSQGRQGKPVLSPPDIRFLSRKASHLLLSGNFPWRRIEIIFLWPSDYKRRWPLPC